MRTPLFLLATLLLAASSLISCKKDTPDPAFSNGTPAEMQQGVEALKAFFDEHAKQQEHFMLDAATGGSLITREGTKITFSPDAFRLGTNPAAGPVNIWVKDLLYPSNMMLSDKPSMAAGGELLQCYGQVIVSADQGGQPLQLAAGAPATVTMPLGVPQGQQDLPLWAGDTSVVFTTKGYNHDNAPTSVAQQVAFRNGMQDTPIPGALSSANTVGNTFVLDSLDTWRNVNMPYKDARPKTTVLGYIGNKYNTLTGTQSLASDPTLLFFKTRTTNTLVKFSNIILNPASGKEGFLSGQNAFPIGQEGTFLAISAIGDKLYAEMRDLAIPQPQAGKNYVAIGFKLTAVTEPQLLALIQEMNKK